MRDIMGGCCRTAVVMVATLLFLLQSGRASAFSVPERLEFDLTYAGILAGHAVQEVRQNDNELQIVSTAHSARWLRFFFPVDDKIESFLVADPNSDEIGYPRFYREKKREGSTHTHRESSFDFAKLMATTVDHLKKEERTHPISKKTFDTLSCFYFFRKMPIEVGKSYFIDIYDSKRIWNTEVKVLRKEEIETPVGVFKTVVIHPLLKSEGIFARTGDIFIWLTDDDRRIPVQMKSKVAVGSITATIIGGSYWPKKK